LGKIKVFIYLSYNSVQSEESGGSSSLKGSPVCWAHSHSHILVLCLGQPVAVHHCKASLSYLRQQGIMLCVLLKNCIQMCIFLKCALFHWWKKSRRGIAVSPSHSMLPESNTLK